MEPVTLAENQRRGREQTTPAPAHRVSVSSADAFLRRAKQRDPRRFAEVAEQYPVLTRWKWREIWAHEVLAGDLSGLGQR
jgi:hypothetical protein